MDAREILRNLYGDSLEDTRYGEDNENSNISEALSQLRQLIEELKEECHCPQDPMAHKWCDCGAEANNNAINSVLELLK